MAGAWVILQAQGARLLQDGHDEGQHFQHCVHGGPVREQRALRQQPVMLYRGLEWETLSAHCALAKCKLWRRSIVGDSSRHGCQYGTFAG